MELASIYLAIKVATASVALVTASVKLFKELRK